MADTKISAATAVATPASADEYATNQAGASKRTNLGQIKTFVTTDPDFAAGSATAGTWPNLASGTLLTTPEAGAIERDATNFYLTTDAGNRAINRTMHLIRCDAARTLPNDTNTNPVFDAVTNGRITLETGLYYFKFLYQITGMSATSGNAQILFGGTGTFAAWNWWLNGLDASANTNIADDDAVYMVTNASAASAVAAAVNTNMRVHGEGTFECTGAGTFIPQIDLVTATAGSVAIGSFFMCERWGGTSVTVVGQWD